MAVSKIATLLLVVVATMVSRGEAARPNILFILTDDQAPWAIGVSGNPLAKTPHMDRIAREGVYLPNAYTVTPVCSPSRAALMTSRYGSELGITDWIHPRREPELGLDAKLPIWPRQLQKAGYHTGLVGKWHLGRQDSQHPTRYGFDHFMGHRQGGWSPVNPTLEQNRKPHKFQGLTADVLADEAMRFVRDHVASSPQRPFLLCWHTRAPHARWLPVAPEDMAPYKGKDIEIPNPDYPLLDIPRVKRMTREYLASVRSVYQRLAEEHGVEWKGRRYDSNDWASGDPLNRALSAASACLNGIVQAGVISAGYSTALGFIHTGKMLSFVYDVSDLYKVDEIVPLVFAVVAESDEGVERRSRMACRDHFHETKFLERLLPDIKEVLDGGDDTGEGSDESAGRSESLDDRAEGRNVPWPHDRPYS